MTLWLLIRCRLHVVSVHFALRPSVRQFMGNSRGLVASLLPSHTAVLHLPALTWTRSGSLRGTICSIKLKGIRKYVAWKYVTFFCVLWVCTHVHCSRLHLDKKNKTQTRINPWEGPLSACVHVFFQAMSALLNRFASRCAA